MIDREKILTVLHKRFPTAAAADLAAAANAIVGLEDEWEDVTGHEPEFGYHFSAQCGEICYLAEQTDRGRSIPGVQAPCSRGLIRPPPPACLMCLFSQGTWLE